MLLKMVLSLVEGLIHLLFSILPNIPTFDLNILNSLDKYVNLIFDNLGLLGFFIDIEIIKILAPLVVIVISFDEIYHVVMWVLKKLPLFKFQ